MATVIVNRTVTYEVDVDAAREDFEQSLEEDGLADADDETIAEHLIELGVEEPWVSVRGW